MFQRSNRFIFGHAHLLLAHLCDVSSTFLLDVLPTLADCKFSEKEILWRGSGDLLRHLQSAPDRLSPGRHTASLSCGRLYAVSPVRLGGQYKKENPGWVGAWDLFFDRGDNSLPCAGGYGRACVEIGPTGCRGWFFFKHPAKDRRGQGFMVLRLPDF